MSVPSYIKLSPQMDMATLINALNQNFNQVQLQDRRKVITDEDGKDRIVLGRQDDGKYSIRVSGDDISVGNATDDQLVMSSDWNMWKIVSSGSTYGLTGNRKRNSNITINSTNIGYVSDILIPLRNLTVPLASVMSATSKPQVFVRQMGTKKDMNYSTSFYYDGSNHIQMYYSYFIRDKYLVVRTILRWIAGSVTINPNNEPFEDSNLYWEIANPTRIVPGGMGGGGSPTGKYVFYDSVVANPYTNVLTGVDRSSNPVSIQPGTYSFIYSYTYQFNDNNESFHFPNGYTLPVWSPIDVDD